MTRVTVTIDFQENTSDDIPDWAKRNRIDLDSLDDLDVTVEIDLSEIDDDDIAREYAARFSDDEDAIARAYRLMAEGSTAAAMDELHAASPRLRPPHDERRLVDLLSRPAPQPAKEAANG